MARGKRDDREPAETPRGFPIDPPVEPMLAKLATELPDGDGWLFEPKWDGFRAIVFRDRDRVYIQSRDLRPLDRYFPELKTALVAHLPARCVVDGEIVIASERGLDFDLLQLRLHPAASRVAKLAAETPSSFVAFDLLAEGDHDLRGQPQAERRQSLEKALSSSAPPVHLTPCTRDRRVAGEWFHRFEGAGLDGVVAKHETAAYQPGKRVMVKVKHARTADCVVAGFRWHKNGPRELVGSLLLGLFDEGGRLHHVGVTSSFTVAARRELAQELEPLRKNALAGHPWREWAEISEGSTRMPGGQSRWSQGKDLSWEPLRIERVCEVRYDHLQGDRFRHATTFLRWRPDRRPEDCRYDQLEVTPPAELAAIFRVARP
jgi:ATP-dependent DNA ligase